MWIVVEATAVARRRRKPPDVPRCSETGRYLVSGGSRLVVTASLLVACMATIGMAQQPVAVTITAIDAVAHAVTVKYREEDRTLALSPALEVTVDDCESAVSDIRSGDKATVFYDKSIREMVRIDVWRKKAPDVRLPLLTNGGFERISDTANIIHWERQTGHVMASPDARSGRHALELRVSAGNDEARVFSIPRQAIKPGGTYRLSLWAKGRGTLSMNVYQYDHANPIGAEFFRDKPGLELTDKWQQLQCEYRPKNQRLKAASLAVVLYGANGRAKIDDVAFFFSESDNPGFTLNDPPLTREVRIAVQTRQADVKIAVAGRPVPILDGVATTRVREGLAAVAVRAVATGSQPGVRLRLLGLPETEGRWRASGCEAHGWHNADFDDREWPIALSQAGGFLWVNGESPKVACFRQILLWNETHHGPDRCILPMTREWAFSQDGFDNLLLALYSPLPFNLDNYELVLDVPNAFELVGLDDKYYERHVLNRQPSRVVRETVDREGERYSRYRIAFDNPPIPADATHYAWLPLQLRGGKPGERTKFFYHRRGHGNFTECEQVLPVSILPPVAGRQPRRILISEYYPISTSALSPTHMRASVAGAASMGFNLAGVAISEPGWGPQWNAYLKSFFTELVAHRFSTSISSPGHFPLCTSHVSGHQSDSFIRWVDATPQARATYFDNRRWTRDRDSMYCPSYMLGEGAERFRKLVSETYAEVLARTPSASVLFLDYEAHAWREESSGGVGASTCFCDHCKRRFREIAGLPRDVDLTNENIHERYFQSWADFHDWQVTELQSQMKEVANALRLRSMIYSWAGFMPFWSKIGGKTDIAFLGSPGNNVAAGSMQKTMDEEGRFLRHSQGVPQVIGQRFSFLGISEAKGGWRQVNALSGDGYVNAKSWKSQILRVVAAFGGGVDIQDAKECVAGMPYWIGEATRIIAAHEDLFFEGERADQLATSGQIGYPDLLVLRKGQRRLVLLFNEQAEDRRVTVRNLELEPGQRARAFEGDDWVPAESLEVVVPAGDAVAVEVR